MTNENKILAMVQTAIAAAAKTNGLDAQKAVAEFGEESNVIAIRLAHCGNKYLRAFGGKEALKEFAKKLNQSELYGLIKKGYTKAQVNLAIRAGFMYVALIGKPGDVRALGWFTKWTGDVLRQAWGGNKAEKTNYLKGSDLRAGMKDLLNYIKAGIESIGAITNAFDCATTMRLYSRILEYKGYADVEEALGSSDKEVLGYAIAMSVVLESAFLCRDEDFEALTKQAEELGVHLSSETPLVTGKKLGQLNNLPDYVPVLARKHSDKWGDIVKCTSLEKAMAVREHMLSCNLNKLSNIMVAFDELEAVKRFYGENSIDACKKFPEAGLPIPGFVFMMNTKKASKMPWGVKLNFKDFKVEVTGVEDNHSEIKTRGRQIKEIVTDEQSFDATHHIVMKSWYGDLYQTLRRSTEPALIAFGNKLLNHVHENEMNYPQFVLDHIAQATTKFPTVVAAMERVMIDRGLAIRSLQDELAKVADKFGVESEEYDAEDKQVAKTISEINKAAANQARCIYQYPYCHKGAAVMPEEAVYIVLGIAMRRYEESKARLEREAEEASIRLDKMAKLVEAFDDGVDVSGEFEFAANIDEREQLINAYEESKAIAMRAFAAIDGSAISDFARTAMPTEWAIFCLLTEWERTQDGSTEGTFEPCVTVALEDGVNERAQGWCLEFVDGIATFKGEIVAQMKDNTVPNGRFIIDFVEDEVGNRKPVAAMPAIFLARQSVEFAKPDDGMLVRLMEICEDDRRDTFGDDVKGYWNNKLHEFESDDRVSLKNDAVEAKRATGKANGNNNNLVINSEGIKIARFYSAASKEYSGLLVGFNGHVIDGIPCQYKNVHDNNKISGCLIVAVQGNNASKPSFASFEFSDIK